MRTLVQVALLVIAGLIFVLIPERRLSPLASERADVRPRHADSESNPLGRLGALVGLDPGSDWPGIRGRVLDLRGRPVAGVTVLHRSNLAPEVQLVGNGNPHAGLEATDGGRTASSEFNGRFELLVDDPTGELSLLTDDWVVLREWRDSIDDWRGIAILLVAPSQPLAGDVIGVDGRELAGAQLDYSAGFLLPDLLRDAGESDRGRFDVSARADERGHFDFNFVPAVEGALLRAAADGYSTQELTAPPGAESRLRIVLSQ
jgi:hypothetical protein